MSLSQARRLAIRGQRLAGPLLVTALETLALFAGASSVSYVGESAVS